MAGVRQVIELAAPPLFGGGLRDRQHRVSAESRLVLAGTVSDHSARFSIAELSIDRIKTLAYAASDPNICGNWCVRALSFTWNLAWESGLINN